MGLSDMTLTYDWEESEWSSLPLGAKLLKLVRVRDVPFQFSGEYEHNFADDSFGPQSVFRLTAKVIFPGPG